MQVTETLSQGLKREYNVVVSAGDLASKLDAQVADLKGKVRINGFRPGKVPVAHLKKVYGRSVMAQVVQDTVDAAQKQVAEGLRLAMEPKVELPTERSEIEAALEARGDLAFKIALEVLPQFEIGDFAEISLERPVAEIEESEVETSLQRLADSRRTFAERPEGEGAEAGDRLTIDFEGKVDGEVFEGGSGKDVEVALGSKSFVPGFEDGLVGAVAGENRVVNPTFPENYPEAKLAGKTAEFAVTVKKVAKPDPLPIDDELAKGLGLESLEALRKMVRERIEGELARASRAKVKRKLLDALAERYSFEVPETLVEQEFAQIWGQVEREQKANGRTFADENTTEEAARAEYRTIAIRRVRLGLLLAEVGAKAEVKVSEEEVTQAVVSVARSYPGQEQQIWDFYRKNTRAIAELRAPIYEEKVVDHILGLAKVEDKKVSREELMRPDEDEEKPTAETGDDPPTVETGDDKPTTET
jgi:trigger factor